MSYEYGARPQVRFDDGTSSQGPESYTGGGGWQPSNEPRNYYEPPTEPTAQEKSKTQPQKKSKKSKELPQLPSSGLTYDTASANQPSYDAPASQHNYYLPPNEQQFAPQTTEGEVQNDMIVAPPRPPRSSKKSDSQKAGFTSMIASIRRSFSKKKKSVPDTSTVVDTSSHHLDAQGGAFIQDRGIGTASHDVQMEDSLVWNEPEPESEKRGKKSSKKMSTKDSRLMSSARFTSVENLRDARNKLILTAAPSTKPGDKTKLVHVRVILLDGEEVTFELDKWAAGEVLLARVCDHVNVDVVDQDFFGLTYIQELELPNMSDKSKKKVPQKIWFWLDLALPIYKQQPEFDKWEFRFQVKFYPPDPKLLREDLSRYQLCLQVRQDLYYGKLPCSWVVHALLGSYTVQSELGDYEDAIEQSESANNDNDAVPAGVRYIQNFAFLDNQSVELLERIAELHKTHKGLTPEEADLRFLENAKRLPLYGVDLHNALDAAGCEIQLGVSSFGVVVYRDGTCLNKFSWPKVVKVSFKQRAFIIYPRADADESSAEEVEFKLADKRLAKRVWIIAVESHAFWRLRSPDALNRKLGSFKRRALSLLSLSNSSATTPFRFSGRTLFEQRQLKQDAELNDTERDSQSAKFDRLVSKRLSTSMPHLFNGERELSPAVNDQSSRLKAAQSLTSLVLPPPRLGSLRDLSGTGAGGSTRSLRGSQTAVNRQTSEPSGNASTMGPNPRASATGERVRKPLPSVPVGNQIVVREIELDDHRTAASDPRASHYAMPSRHPDEEPRSLKKKGKQKAPAPEPLPSPVPEPAVEHVRSEATVERQPTVSSIDDGYERLRDVVSSPAARPDKLKKQFSNSDSETEIDRVPANYGDRFSTLDSPTYSDGYQPNGLLQLAGVTDLDHSNASGHSAAVDPSHAYSAPATYTNANARLLNNSRDAGAAQVTETNLDDFGANAHGYSHPPPTNGWYNSTVSLLSSKPPVHAVTDDDDAYLL